MNQSVQRKVGYLAKAMLVGIFLTTLLSSKSVLQAANPIAAFSGAEGFGAKSLGGRGGRVIEVTTLHDTGPGSLRTAIETDGSRIIIFRVGGTIELRSSIVIKRPFITIAGQSAPGGGITLKNHGSNIRSPIEIKTHDVIIRYIRSRPGPSAKESDLVDALTISAGHNIIIDHCSFSWATDEIVNTWNDVHDITIQWSIMAEGLHNSSHPKGKHSKGLHLGGDGAARISVHHNLFAHNYDRNPNINTTGVVDLVNNVFYNATRWTEIKDKYGSSNVNVVNNYYKRGPSSRGEGYEVFYYKNLGNRPKVHVTGNIGFHRPANGLPEELIMREDSRWMKVNDRFPAPLITTATASEALGFVLANAGAVLPQRDDVDQRIVNDVIHGTGAIIDDPSDVGGWPKVAGGMPPADTDHDGMPDSWEQMRGLNKNDPSDGLLDTDGDGFTNLEKYLSLQSRNATGL